MKANDVMEKLNHLFNNINKYKIVAIDNNAAIEKLNDECVYTASTDISEMWIMCDGSHIKRVNDYYFICDNLDFIERKAHIESFKIEHFSDYKYLTNLLVEELDYISGLTLEDMDFNVDTLKNYLIDNWGYKINM